RTAIKVDELRRIETVRAEVDTVFVYMRLVSLHLLDESDERAVEGNDVGKLAPAENRGAHLEEILGRGVDVFDAQPLADQQRRMGQRIEQRFGQELRRLDETPRAWFFGRSAQPVYPRDLTTILGVHKE